MCLYNLFRLNKLFHFIGVPLETQIKLIPKHLYRTNGVLSHPYWVRVERIKWGGAPDKSSRIGLGYIFDGDWDLIDKRPLEKYLDSFIYSRTVKQLFVEGKKIRETDQYQEMAKLIKAGSKDWRTRGCRSVFDVEKYFMALNHAFEKIRDEGYKTQNELGYKKSLDEITLFVDRNGELHRQQGSGQHRFAIVKILEIDTIPVIIRGVHKEWAKKAVAEFDCDPISAIDIKFRNEIAVNA